MEALAYALVLVAAFCHAAWNALVKASGDRYVVGALLMVPGGVLALPVVVLVPLPTPETWPLLALSYVLHITYFSCLIQAYRVGDLGQIYPLARGLSPLLLVGFAFVLAGEIPGPVALVGIGVLSAGIVGLAWRRRDAAAMDPRGLLFALATAVFIAAYTAVDAVAVRGAGEPLSFIAWYALMQSIGFPAAAYLVRRRTFFATVRSEGRKSLAGGLLATGSYALMLWAFTLGPIAVMAALRETSVLMAVLLGSLLLKETLGVRRLAAATAIVVGAVMLRF